jgi:predicted TIM-barrel fold metal-dependent hydrolase
MLIDCHTHIVPPVIKQDRYKYYSDPLFRLLYDNPKAKLATVEDLITSMDKNGVDISIALNLGWSDAALCHETNDYIMEAVARYPRRIIGFGTAALDSGDTALREIERCASGGLKGIGEMRLDTNIFVPRNTGPLDDFINTIIDHKLFLLLHSSEPVGHEYAGKGDTTPYKLYSIITRFPDLTLIAAHWGGGLPFYALMPEVRASLNNVYFDTAASPLLYSPQVFRTVIDIIGAGHILVGSDYPLLSINRIVREIKSLSLPPETEEALLYRNARRLLDIGLSIRGRAD